MARSFDKPPPGGGTGGGGHGPGDGDDGRRPYKPLDFTNLDMYGAVGGVDPDDPVVGEVDSDTPFVDDLDPLPLPLRDIQPLEIEPWEVQPSPTDLMESSYLYVDFIREQMHVENISEPISLDETLAMVDPGGVALMDWTRAGRELRQLADVFSRSKEREYVRRRARTIDIRNLSYSDFYQLLKGLFEGEGITRERILVLFFFCADIALESLTRGYYQTFHVLVTWTIRFIGTKVLRWVHEHGGWASVLRNALTITCQVTACTAFVCVAVSCVLYIKRGGPN